MARLTAPVTVVPPMAIETQVPTPVDIVATPDGGLLPFFGLGKEPLLFMPGGVPVLGGRYAGGGLPLLSGRHVTEYAGGGLLFPGLCLPLVP